MLRWLGWLWLCTSWWSPAAATGGAARAAAAARETPAGVGSSLQPPRAAALPPRCQARSHAGGAPAAQTTAAALLALTAAMARVASPSSAGSAASATTMAPRAAGAAAPAGADQICTWPLGAQWQPAQWQSDRIRVRNSSGVGQPAATAAHHARQRRAPPRGPRRGGSPRPSTTCNMYSAAGSGRWRCPSASCLRRSLHRTGEAEAAEEKGRRRSPPRRWQPLHPLAILGVWWLPSCRPAPGSRRRSVGSRVTRTPSRGPPQPRLMGARVSARPRLGHWRRRGIRRTCSTRSVGGWRVTRRATRPPTAL